MNNTQIGKTSGGPSMLTEARNATAAQIPFVLPQVIFKGGLTQQRMGQGLLAQVAAASASTNYTIAHNLGHPINCVWVVMAPTGTFAPTIAITSNTTQSVTVKFSTAANPVTVALF
jgi:hypothetical protein